MQYEIFSLAEFWLRVAVKFFWNFGDVFCSDAAGQGNQLVFIGKRNGTGAF